MAPKGLSAAASSGKETTTVVTPARRKLAEKFVFQKDRQDAFVPDSLLGLVTFLYTEEEAEVVSALGYVGFPAGVIGRRLKRPARQVKGIESLILDRVGIGISRLLEKYSSLHISGPKYRPK